MYSLYDAQACPQISPMVNISGSACWFNALIQATLGLSSLNLKLAQCKNLFRNNATISAYIELYLAPPDKVAEKHARLFEAFMRSPCYLSKKETNPQGCASDAFTIFLD